MARLRRKSIEIFSLSFLDCICCGFGAVLLLFVLTSGQQADTTRSELGSLQAQVAQAETALRVALAEAAKQTPTSEAPLRESLTVENAALEKAITAKQALLAAATQAQSEQEAVLKQLTADKAALPKAETTNPLLPPNATQRQYLTHFKMEGRHTLLLVEVSGGMLDEHIDGAIARMAGSLAAQRKAPKWQRTLQAVRWLLAALGTDRYFQVIAFNETAAPVLPERGKQWLETSDTAVLQKVLDRLEVLNPAGSANLEEAFLVAHEMSPKPDSIILLTDGLPTQSTTAPARGLVNESKRVEMFRAAEGRVPSGIPISIILFPIDGDPAAAALFWRLALRTGGALVTPSPQWPDL